MFPFSPFKNFRKYSSMTFEKKTNTQSIFSTIIMEKLFTKKHQILN